MSTTPATSAPHVRSYPAGLGWVPVWRRNLLFWRKLAPASMLANLGEPILYLLALGYGLGALVGGVGGIPYQVFLASGFICSSAMMTATFEATYSAYTRMAAQHTWDAMISTPLGVGDVVRGEIAWATTKSLMSATGVMVVGAAIGAVRGWQALLAIPAAALTGLCFSAIALVVTTIARSYDSFLYYTTLVMTPMFLLSGVFFPLAQMPEAIQRLATVLPLTHAVALVRPLVIGGSVEAPLLHVAVLLGYAATASALAARLARRRMLV
ncbi:MAG: ABC transporter permease [Ectothiorhodospiraceae bacterium]|nr:ABC transporter permease [Chromatiales bacterium]MCP5153630.1 ABC transporter permease [Ectothiorhodospiraceae bacterium]